MVRLCLALVRDTKSPDPVKAFRVTLEKRAADHTQFFRKI
jgi:hypothetical protein